MGSKAVALEPEIEYKVEIYITNDDSREKDAVCKQCAKNSGGKRIFLMARAKAEDGRGVEQQIEYV